MSTARLISASKGESHYEGKPCRNCGTTQKYVLNAT